MKLKFFLLLFLASVCLNAGAQQATYGQVDIDDLKLTTCDFEKGANAMVLFDVAKVAYNNSYYIVMNRHKRVKIFTTEGISAADMRIEYWGGGHNEVVKNVEASTYNLVNGKVERVVLDKTQIVNVKVDKQHRAIVFVFPNIKPGSVIEYKYTLQTPYVYNYPSWAFQKLIPTRYSEIDGSFENEYRFNTIQKTTQKLDIDSAVKVKFGSRHIWAMKDIPAFRVEPYMHSIEDNIQSIYFKHSRRFSFWGAVTTEALEDVDFGLQFMKKLDAEEPIIARAKAMKTDNEKMEYLFNTVKNTVAWNEVNAWYTVDGIQKAWKQKKGNSTEINLILYHLLKASGVNPKLILFGTRDNGELETDNIGFGRLNKTVVQVPIDSLNYYVLDATDKYNTFNNTPSDLLNLNMLSIEPETKNFDLVKLNNNQQSEEVVFVNAEIKLSGKMEGSTQRSSSTYKRIDKLQLYDKVGEVKYIESEIKDKNKGVTITDYRIMNAKVDSLPLREDFNFKLDMTGFDGDYIYFSPNLFTGLDANPFINDTRFSDIDFIYLNRYLINGRYKIPAGYKIDALPKSQTIVMPDKSISFKRVIGEIEGAIIVNYKIGFGKAKYSRDEYKSLHDFYKIMYEMLNEQIVLKKQPVKP